MWLSAFHRVLFLYFPSTFRSATYNCFGNGGSDYANCYSLLIHDLQMYIGICQIHCACNGYKGFEGMGCFEYSQTPGFNSWHVFGLCQQKVLFVLQNEKIKDGVPVKVRKWAR
jgi:hypothetical protein